MLALVLGCNALALAGPRQSVATKLHVAARGLPSLGRLPATNELNLTLSLPMRNKPTLTNLLQDLYQRGGARFGKYLTSEEFAEEFGPTMQDYQSVMDFARGHGLRITGTHPNRTLLNVSGSVKDIELALNVHLHRFQHPKENRIFFAPDTAPSVELNTPLLTISGLNNFTRPHPCVTASSGVAQTRVLAGSGAGGAYLGLDFRAAYVPGVALNGSGQSIGLFELDGYNPSDITNYEAMSGLPNVPLQTILIDGFSGTPSGTISQVEVSVDMELAIAMAPGITNLIVYEGNDMVSNGINDVLNRMATDNLAKQLSSSYAYDIDAATQQIFQQMAAQGQSFFQASGDSDAYAGFTLGPVDDPNITVVGGTALSTSGPQGNWTGEVVWNSGNGVGSGGGISKAYPIPFWQQGINMTSNHGSITMRNLPDVAAVAQNVYAQVGSQSGMYVGTSLSAPIWAGFTALVNQQAAQTGHAPLGFANPSIYAIARSASYAATFHDITLGSNTSTNSPTNFSAVPGYDLCTGWGSPRGSNLINALLAPVDPLVISPQIGFTAIGSVGGPFDIQSRTYTLTNAGVAALNWVAGTISPWLTLSQTNGTLTPGGTSVLLTISLNSVASNLLISDNTATLFFINTTDGTGQNWPVDLHVGNGGFETGDFSSWTLVGTPGYDTIEAGEEDSFNVPPFAGVLDSSFVHSGLFGAFLGESGQLGTLTQTLPTTPHDTYLVSCWLKSLSVSNNGVTAPNEFRVRWGGTNLFDATNMPAFDWTNLQFLVPASTSSTAFELGFQDDPGALALDDVSIQHVPPLMIQSAVLVGGNVVLTWNALPSLVYQLQYTTNLAAPNWVNAGPPVTATANVVTNSDLAPTDPARFYRFSVAP